MSEWPTRDWAAIKGLRSYIEGRLRPALDRCNGAIHSSLEWFEREVLIGAMVRMLIEHDDHADAIRTPVGHRRRSRQGAEDQPRFLLGWRTGRPVASVCRHEARIGVGGSDKSAVRIHHLQHEAAIRTGHLRCRGERTWAGLRVNVPWLARVAILRE